MKIIVSACLAGDNCKYNGGNNFNQKMMDFLRTHEMIKVCPEVLGGLPTPRSSADLCIKAGYKVLDVEDIEEYLGEQG